MKAAPMTLRRRIVPAAAATVAVAALAGTAWYAFDAISSQPIARVSFAGDLHRIAPSDLEACAQAVQGVDANAAALDAIREAARKIPWVRAAMVRRRFPDAVEVTLETHEPLARWNDAALASTRGEIFTAPYDAPLPRFHGSDDSAPRMATEYPAIVRAVAPLSSTVTDVSLSPRGAWQVVLDSGLTLDLGRDDIEARLARFAAAWPQLAARGVASKHADLRYAKGFAQQRVAETKPPQPTARTGKSKTQR